MRALKETVKAKYGEAAQAVIDGAEKTAASACCTTSCCGGTSDPITTDLYDASQTAVLPDKAVAASLGCGNPTALAELRQGETVLDLGSGGGIDVLLSARRVGPTGKAYGLDMTDEMLALAEENKRRSGLANVEFLRGEMERIPLPDNAVDVIISNCVINLAADRTACSRKRFACSSPAGASPSRTWWCAASCPMRCARAWSCGRVAWRARSPRTITAPSSRAPASPASISRSRASIRRRMPAGSWAPRASTPTPSPGRPKASWSAPSFARASPS